MRELICHKRKVSYKIGVCLMLAMLLFAAGCGSGNTQKDKAQKENPSSQASENEGSQTSGIKGGQASESQGSQEVGNQGGQAAEDSGSQEIGNQGSQAAEDPGSQDLGNQGSQAAEDPGSQANGQTSGESQSNFANQPKIEAEEAKEAALQHAGLTAPEVTFIKEELDYDDGKWEYDIEFVTSTTKYEYEISAKDGAILSSSQELIEKVSQNQQGQGIISEDQAKEAVLNHAGFSPEQVAYIKVELEQDDGIMQYEIEFYADGKEYSSKVNAATGAIIEYEID